MSLDPAPKALWRGDQSCSPAVLMPCHAMLLGASMSSTSSAKPLCLQDNQEALQSVHGPS